MRKEKFAIGNYIHVYNRGIRKMAIANDEDDRWRFLQILRYFNNKNSPIKTFQELSWLIKNRQCSPFGWPARWPAQEPLVEIVAYCLMPNHYHLLLRETNGKGTSTFMQKLGLGYTNFLNSKYKESGRIFQGAYKAKIIESEEYLQYADAYIQIINPLELIDGGLPYALKNFNKAFQLAIESPFSSLGESFNRRNLSIINRNSIKDKFPSTEKYKEFAKDILLSRSNSFPME